MAICPHHFQYFYHSIPTTSPHPKSTLCWYHRHYSICVVSSQKVMYSSIFRPSKHPNRCRKEQSVCFVSSREWRPRIKREKCYWLLGPWSPSGILISWSQGSTVEFQCEFYVVCPNGRIRHTMGCVSYIPCWSLYHSDTPPSWSRYLKYKLFMIMMRSFDKKNLMLVTKSLSLTISTKLATLGMHRGSFYCMAHRKCANKPFTSDWCNFIHSAVSVLLVSGAFLNKVQVTALYSNVRHTS